MTTGTAPRPALSTSRSRRARRRDESGVGIPTFRGRLPGVSRNQVLNTFRPGCRKRHDRCIDRQPPRSWRESPPTCPRNADGNETSGVPSVLHQARWAPISLEPDGGGILCRRGWVHGGYVPFARTRAERQAAARSRLRRGAVWHARGYACVVEKAARSAVSERFLLQADADRLGDEAPTARAASRRDSSEANRQRGRASAPRVWNDGAAMLKLCRSCSPP